LSRPNFHVRTKHIKVDYYFIGDMVMAKRIVTLYVTSSGRLVISQ